MRLVAMTSYFDENPGRLMECMNHVADLGATHIALVDGAYALFPDGSPSSGWFQLYAAKEAGRRGMGVLFYSPDSVWAGNEVEKRQTMLDLALAITNEHDWLMPWDADFHLECEPVDLKPLLAAHAGRWGDIQLTDSTADDGWHPIRLLLRAVKGMRFGTNHYTYHYPDGDSTVVGPNGADRDRGLKLPVRIRHRPNDRAPGRRERQAVYYERRHALEIEK